LKVAAHVDELLTKSNGALFRKHESLLPRVFNAAAAFLEEGSLETRTYGKRILWSVQRSLSTSQLGAMKAACGNEMRQRKVAEALEGLGPPVAPQRVANSLARYASGNAASPTGLPQSPSGGCATGMHVDSHSLMPPRWKAARDGRPRVQSSPLRDAGAGALAAAPPPTTTQRPSFKSGSPLVLSRHTSSTRGSEGRPSDGSDGRRLGSEVGEGLKDMVIGRSMSRKP